RMDGARMSWQAGWPQGVIGMSNLTIPLRSSVACGSARPRLEGPIWSRKCHFLTDARQDAFAGILASGCRQKLPCQGVFEMSEPKTYKYLTKDVQVPDR